MAAEISERGWMPLTLAQRDFWEEFSLHPDDPVSTVAHCLHIHGKVDTAALAEAIAQTLREADVLSVRFGAPAGAAEVMQTCDPDRAPALRVVDLTACDDPEAEAHGLMRTDVEARLDLRTQPLCASWLLTCSETRVMWYLRGHHIILDGYGMALLEQRCARLYEHMVSGTDPGAGFLPLAAFLAEEKAYGQSARRTRDREFWAGALAEMPELPVLEKGGEAYGAEGYHDTRVLAAPRPEVSEQTGLGWPDLLVALSGLYVCRRMVGSGAAVLWLPLMNRLGSVAAQVPAMVVNILPVQLRAAGDETLGDALRGAARALRLHRRHGRYRVEQLAADLGLGAGRRFYFSPLVNVLPFGSPRFGSCRVHREVLASGVGDGFNITFRGSEDGRTLMLDLDVEAAMMPRLEFERHHRELGVFLDYALADGAMARPVAALLPDTAPAS